MKIELDEDEAQLIECALVHYSAYLRATNRDDSRYARIAERIKKPPASETLPGTERKRNG